jgi:ABC-type uncharacterized transport system permease subunit
MDRWLLVTATLLAVIGGAWGMLSVHRGRRSKWTIVWMIAVLLCQFAFLALRGKQREACPLGDLGEILVFLSWALTLFYLLVGSAYRISLLGVFTAPVVALFQAAALFPGLLEVNPGRTLGANPLHELHAATSVLGYGALALAAVAGVMFLVLDRQLKEHHLKSGLFRNLPPVRELLISLERLLRMGGGLLTIGITAGFLMPHDKSALGHLIAAVLVWLSYVTLVAVKTRRGLTGRRFALLAVGLFILSLGVFAFV